MLNYKSKDKKTIGGYTKNNLFKKVKEKIYCFTNFFPFGFDC